MSEYTAADFEKARFAEHPVGGATATRNGYKGHWVLSNGILPMSDAEMALGGWVPVWDGVAPTLGSLAEAYATAEVPTEATPIREGDEIICLMGTGGYLLRRASVHEHGRVPLPSVRVLSRAPQREPWQDLADALGPVIAEANGGEDQRLTDEWAQRLYERGVRVSKNEQE